MKNIIVCGLSSSGKTSLTNVLEDLGYRCIDQLPKELYKELINSFNNEDFSYDKLAISSNLIDLDYLIECFNTLGIKFSLLLTDASKDVLLKRYNQTKRVHPLIVNGSAETLEEAIDIEKEILKNISIRLQLLIQLI